jgi:Mu transposase, C-terminal
LAHDVIDAWASKAERLPVAWILEECKRRTRSRALGVPSRRAIDARLRDRGPDSLIRQQFVAKEEPAIALTPRSRKALAIVQKDLTMVDVMVVDKVLRQSMGWTWITVAVDIATRVVLGSALRLKAPSATSVGLALTMACLPKDQWLTDPERFVIDFLPAETRRVGRNGFQINRIRYWDPLLARLFPPRTRVFGAKCELRVPRSQSESLSQNFSYKTLSLNVVRQPPRSFLGRHIRATNRFYALRPQHRVNTS